MATRWRRRTAKLGVATLVVASATGALTGAYEVVLIVLSVLAAMAITLLLDVRRAGSESLRACAALARNVEALGELTAICAESCRELRDRIQETETSIKVAREALSSDLHDTEGRLASLNESLSREVGVEREAAASRYGTAVKILRRLSHEPVAQLQALDQLRSRLGCVIDSLPLLGGWAIDPSTALILLDMIQTRRPARVMECGSGSSTVWVAEMLRQVGAGHLVSIEHDEYYVDIVRQRLDEAGLSEWAEVRHAPLVQNSGGVSEQWYDLAVISDVGAVELLLVDGPPAKSGRLARYPALPLLGRRLAEGARVVLDDARRSDERRTIDRWQTEGLIDEHVIRVQSAAVLSWVGS